MHTRFGPDAGGDIPRPTDFVDGLRPLLDRFGNDDRAPGVLRQYAVTIVSRLDQGGDDVGLRRDGDGRRERGARTQERIVSAGSEIAHESRGWDWKALTFRAVAERAGVGERTVYRHFPTERHLHDAVMQRLEAEAGVTYEDVTLENLADVTARVFATRHRFAVEESVPAPEHPTFVAVDERRRRAVLSAVTAAAPHWSDAERQTVAALLDVLWNLPSYERLVSVWGVPSEEATPAINWLIAKVVQAIENDEPPPVSSRRGRRPSGNGRRRAAVRAR